MLAGRIQILILAVLTGAIVLPVQFTLIAMRRWDRTAASLLAGFALIVFCFLGAWIVHGAGWFVVAVPCSLMASIATWLLGSLSSARAGVSKPPDSGSDGD